MKQRGNEEIRWQSERKRVIENYVKHSSGHSFRRQNPRNSIVCDLALP